VIFRANLVNGEVEGSTAKLCLLVVAGAANFDFLLLNLNE